MLVGADRPGRGHIAHRTTACSRKSTRRVSQEGTQSHAEETEKLRKALLETEERQKSLEAQKQPSSALPEDLLTPGA